MPRPKASTIGPVLTWQGKAADPALRPGHPVLIEVAGSTHPQPAWPDWPEGYPQGGLLFCGDNLASLSRLIADGFAGRVQMVYIDPPFKTGGDFALTVAPRGAKGGRKTRLVQYSDSWDDETYLSFMHARLHLLHTLLAETGSLFLHCDYRTAHHLRCLLDEIFGADRFRNQLIWAYGGSARGAKAVAGQFGRNHDLILWYGKGRSLPYTPVYTERRVPVSEAARLGYRRDEQGNWFKTAPRGDYTDASIARLEAEGRIHRTRTGSVRIKYPLQSDGRHVIEKVMVGDVWTDIPDAMHAGEAEAWAYPTRKPEALLERIIACSTRPGDLVLDAFAGSGTTLAVAQRLGRRWIGCDANPRAVQLAARRAQEILAPDTIISRTRPALAAEPEAPTGFAVYAETGRAGASTGQAAIRLVRQHDAWDVIIDDYRSPDVEAWLGERGGDWRQHLEAVLIDSAYDGHTFVRRLVDWPARNSRTIAGTYVLPPAATGPQVAVKLLDLLGRETMVVLALPGR